MASKISRRRVGEEQDSARPHKKARSSQNDSSTAQFDVFGESYAVERNEDIFVLHKAIQLPAKIHGGYIRGSVVDVMKYPNRQSAGLLLKLGPSRTDPEAPRLLECELMHPKALECQQPVYKDTVYVALTEAKVGINDKDEQLCFKLRFESSLIYIVPFERDNANPHGEPRILKLVDTGKNALQIRKKASAPPEKDQPGHDSVETESHSLLSAGIPAISHKTDRVRKRDTRHVNNKQDTSSGPAYKVTRKLAKAAKKANLMINASPLVVAQIPSVPEGAETNSPPTLDNIEPPAVDAAGDAPPVPDDNQTVKVQRGEELPTVQEDKKTEPSRGGFVSGDGIKFLALDEIEGLPHRAPVNVVGVVEWIGDPRPTRFNEFFRVFRLSDQTRPSFRVQLFTKELQWMPDVRVGQILLLHNAHFEVFQGAPMVIGPAAALKWIAYDPQTKQTFFSADSAGPKYQYLDQKAKDYFATLADSKLKILNDPNYVVIAPPIRKHKLLSELKHHGTFFDATVEILSVETVSWGVEIFVTDYTRNDLFDINENNSWGLVGRKRALRMEAWPQERISYGAACLVKPGKFYLMKNFSFRSTKGHGWAAKVLKQDNAEFRQVREDSQDPDLRRLIEWAVYILLRGQQLTTLVRRKAAFAHEAPALDEDTEVSGVDDVYLGNPIDANQASSSVAEAKPVPVEEVLSGYTVFCELMSPYANFKAIKDDPRCHVEYKIRGRIVDITPSDPREMIQLYCTNCEEIVTTSRKEQASCSLCKSTTSLELDVRLSLLVVDEADESLSVIVSGDEAKHLFGINSANSNGNDLSVEPVAEDVVNKLRNVVGKLWVDGPCFTPFVNEANTPQGDEIQVFSPWIDLAIRSWHVKDVDASSVHSSSWVRKYSLFKCIFRV